MYSKQDLTLTGEESLEDDLTLDVKDDATQHLGLSKADKQHLYNRHLYIFYDPLGSPSPRKERCVFIFDAERLMKLLEGFPKPAAGFIEKGVEAA